MLRIQHNLFEDGSDDLNGNEHEEEQPERVRQQQAGQAYVEEQGQRAEDVNGMANPCI